MLIEPRREWPDGYSRRWTYLGIDTFSFDTEYSVRQRLFEIGLIQNTSTNQFIGNISDNLIQITIYPLIDLVVQMLRHKVLKVFAHRHNPLSKKIVYFFIGHIKERSKFSELFLCEIRDIKIIIAIRELDQIVFNEACSIFVSTQTWIFAKDRWN